MAEEMLGRWPIESILLDLKTAYDDDSELRTFWSEESVGLPSALFALRDHLVDRYAYIRVLGIGGSGSERGTSSSET
jgi:hypothetical protein